MGNIDTIYGHERRIADTVTRGVSYLYQPHFLG